MSNHKRIEVEEVENGFEVTTWEHEDDEKATDMMYPSPKKFIAKDMDEVMELFKKKFAKK